MRGLSQTSGIDNLCTSDFDAQSLKLNEKLNLDEDKYLVEIKKGMLTVLALSLTIGYVERSLALFETQQQEICVADNDVENECYDGFQNSIDKPMIDEADTKLYEAKLFETIANGMTCNHIRDNHMKPECDVDMTVIDAAKTVSDAAKAVKVGTDDSHKYDNAAVYLESTSSVCVKHSQMYDATLDQ